MFLLRRRYTVAVPSVGVRQHEVLQVSSLRPRASGVKPLRRMRKTARRVFRWACRVAGQTAGRAASMTAGQAAGQAAGHVAGQAAGMTAGQAVGMSAGQAAGHAASMAAARNMPDCLPDCQHGAARSQPGQCGSRHLTSRVASHVVSRTQSAPGAPAQLFCLQPGNLATQNLYYCCCCCCCCCAFKARMASNVRRSVSICSTRA